MVVEINIDYKPYTGTTDIFGQEQFMVEEGRDIGELSSSFGEFSRRFEGFEIAPKIRNLNEEITKLGYAAISKDVEVHRFPSEDKYFRTFLQRHMTSVSNFSKKTVYLLLREAKQEFPKSWSEPTCYYATYRLNGVVVFPQHKEAEDEKNLLIETVSNSYQ